MDLSNVRELVERAQQEPEAFGLLYDLYYKQIFNYTLKRTGHVQAAQDITADVFFSAFSKLWQFSWKNVPFSAWLYKITTNKINDFFKKGKSTFSLDVLLEHENISLASDINLEAELIQAQSLMAQQEQVNVLARNLKKLDFKYQEVLSLKYFENKKIWEISEILGKPEGTVKSLLSRGAEKLQTLMQPFAPPQVIKDDSIINEETYEQ